MSINHIRPLSALREGQTAQVSSLQDQVLPVSAGAAEETGEAPWHTVVRGDTMWKLAVRYEVGTSEPCGS